MKVYRIPSDIIASQGGFTHKITVSDADLTVTTTTQPVTLLSIPAGGVVGRVASRVKTAFVHATATTVTATVGVTGTVAGHLGSQSVTSTTAASAIAGSTNTAYTAATNLIATITCRCPTWTTSKQLLGLDPSTQAHSPLHDRWVGLHCLRMLDSMLDKHVIN